MNNSLSSSLILGTRGSLLAQAQTDTTSYYIKQSFPHMDITKKIVETAGDIDLSTPLHQFQQTDNSLDKGVFTKQLEHELLANTIDIAVHSLKDVPTVVDDEFMIYGALTRANTADILISKQPLNKKQLVDKKWHIATSSVRRKRMLQHFAPATTITDIRGNVQTRLTKLLNTRNLDGIILAEAGLQRLNLLQKDNLQIIFNEIILYCYRLDFYPFLPAVSQGAIGFEIKKERRELITLLDAICDIPTWLSVRAERHFLLLLEAGCHTPVGVQSNIIDNTLSMQAIVYAEDNSNTIYHANANGDKQQPEHIAQQLYQNLTTK